MLRSWGARIVAVLVALVWVAAPTAAHASEATFAVEAPPGAQVAWIELEQAGLASDAVVVSARVAGGPWTTVPMTATTFGLHGSLGDAADPLGAGLLEVRVASGGGASTLTPDLAVTVLDAASAVVATADAQLELAAAAPAAETDATEPAAGALAVTGGTSLAILAVIAAAVLAVGAALRARRRRREERA